MNLNQYIEIRRTFNVLRKGTPAPSRIIFDEFAILCALHDHTGLSASELAEMQRIPSPTMAHRGSHLAQLGYLSRSASAEDRRRMRCSLTRKGTSCVRGTCQAILDDCEEDESFSSLGVGDVVPIATKMGSVPMTADTMTLLCFVAAGTRSLTITSVVEMTELLQPTISMAVLRLEGSGCIERPANAPLAGRRPTRRAVGCVLSDSGERAARRIARSIETL